MARNETLKIGQYEWTQLTNADITSAVFQVNGAHNVMIAGTVGEVAPTSRKDGLIFPADSFEGEASRSLADLFPGISATRLYAKSLNGGSSVFISHA